jgi:guanosine-3',5'-bis(diphosphate) 3'-pyrophosphohydrolase
MDATLQAIAFAARRHQGQMRKDEATPYISHPFRVMLTVCREFGVSDVDTLCAAALHDTIEDTRTDFDDVAEAFGETIAGYVALLTKDTRFPEKEREDRYFEGLRVSPVAVKLCKVADTLDNLRDSRGSKGGNRKKTLEKAERLLGIFEPAREPELARALEILKREMKA